MWKHASGIAVIAGLLTLLMPTPVLAQATAQRTETEIQAERDAQGYMPFRLWDRPDVRATRVEIKPMATRAVHQHDDVKFHLFIPLAGRLQLTVGSDKPIDAPEDRRSILRAALHTDSETSVPRLQWRWRSL